MNKDAFIQGFIIAILVGLILFIFSWLQSDITRLNDKVDKFIETYVQVVGEKK